MSELRAIAYVSTATRPLTDAQLEALLVEARALNEASKITGVLLYSDGNFMQYFEGPAGAVSTALKRIESSHRHKGMMVLLDAPIAHRSFPDWKMGFAQPTESELLKLSTAQWKSDAHENPGSAIESPALTLLRGFWRNARR